MNKFNIIIASPHDRDNLVAEIWYKDELVCEVNTEQNSPNVILYSNKEYNLESFLIALQEAKSSLNV